MKGSLLALTEFKRDLPAQRMAFLLVLFLSTSCEELSLGGETWDCKQSCLPWLLTPVQEGILFFFFSLKMYLFPFKCMSVLLTCIYVDHMPAWCSWRLQEGIRSPETGIMASSELTMWILRS